MNRLGIIPLLFSLFLFSHIFTTPIYAQQILLDDTFENGLVGWEYYRPENILLVSSPSHSQTHSVKVSHDGLNCCSYLTHVFTTPTVSRVAVMMYDDMQTPSNAFIFVSIADSSSTRGASIGIRPATSQTNYVFCPTEDQNTCMDSGVPRSAGWHQMKIFVTPKGTYGKIDAISLSNLLQTAISTPVNTSLANFQKVNMGVICQGCQATGYFDDIYINTWPSPGTDFDIAWTQIQLFLSIYPSLNISSIDQMIKARKSEFCEVNPPNDGPCPQGNPNRPPLWHYYEQLFHVYRALQYQAAAHIIAWKKLNQSSELSKAIDIFTYIENEYSWWKQNKSGSVIGLNQILHTWPIWWQLPANVRTLIQNHARDEANYFISQYQPYSEYIGNSSGEENSWPGSYLASIALAFPQESAATNWMNRAKFFMFHTFTKGESYGGYTSRTIYDDFIMDNHDHHPHPGYAQGTAGGMAYLSFLSRKVTGSSPTEFKHWTIDVWKKTKNYIDFRNFLFKGNRIVPQARDQNNDGIPDYTPGPNVFVPSGRSDWGSDALMPTTFRLMKEEYADNAVNDSETGFSTNDLARHSLEYQYYINNGFLWKYQPANTTLTEMRVDHGLAHYYPNWQNEKSYIWFQNSIVTQQYAQYFFLFDPVFSFPSTAPSPTVTPTLIPIQGDLNNDRKVTIEDLYIAINSANIFTYNLVVSNYGK